MMAYTAIILMAMNFMLAGNYILFVLFAGICIKNKSFRANWKFLILLAFSATYILADTLSSSSTPAVVWFLPIAYIVGYNWEMKGSDDYRTILGLIFCIALGMCFHVFLNMCYELLQNRGFNYGAIHYDFWSKKVSAATGQMSNFAISASLIPFILLRRKKYLLSLILITPCILYGTIVGSRTRVFLVALSLAIGLSVFAFSSKRKSARIALLAMIAIISLFILLIESNTFGLSEMINNSYLLRRLSSESYVEQDFFSSERWNIRRTYLQNALVWPWGGGKLRDLASGLYAHDIFLDTLNTGGIFALCFLLIYSISLVRNALFFTRRGDSFDRRVLVVPYLSVILTEMLMEPIIEGAPVFLICVVIIDAAMTRANEMGTPNENSISVKLF